MLVEEDLWRGIVLAWLVVLFLGYVAMDRSEKVKSLKSEAIERGYAECVDGQWRWKDGK